MDWLGLAKPDSEYFGAQDLPNLSSEIIATIKSYGIENIRSKGGIQKKGVLRFEEELKPWIVCKEKLKPIKEKYGRETDNWIGKKITLYFEPNIYFGKEKTGGVRAKIVVQRTTPLPKCKKCNGDITAAGAMTAEQVAAYTASKYGEQLCGKCASEIKKQQEVTNETN